MFPFFMQILILSVLADISTFHMLFLCQLQQKFQQASGLLPTMRQWLKLCKHCPNGGGLKRFLMILHSFFYFNPQVFTHLHSLAFYCLQTSYIGRSKDDRASKFVESAGLIGYYLLMVYCKVHCMEKQHSAKRWFCSSCVVGASESKACCHCVSVHV